MCKIYVDLTVGVCGAAVDTSGVLWGDGHQVTQGCHSLRCPRHRWVVVSTLLCDVSGGWLCLPSHCNMSWVVFLSISLQFHNATETIIPDGSRIKNEQIVWMYVYKGVAATRATKMVLVTVSSTLGYLTYIKKIFTYNYIYVIFNIITYHVTALMKYYFIIWTVGNFVWTLLLYCCMYWVKKHFWFQDVDN